MWRMVAAVIVLVLTSSVAPAGADAAEIALPPANGGYDNQISGDFTPAADVQVLSRDRSSKPAPGLYNICYVNGFQTQAFQKKFWHKHWSLVLKDHGKPVGDPNWDEWLLDIRTPRKRAEIAKIVGHWIDGCANSGFDAVEFDNLDSFSRSHHLLTRADTRAMSRLLTARTHANGLAAAQNNWAGFDGTRVGFDFALTEECAHYNECGLYVADYGDLVYDIEYSKRDFHTACAEWGDQLAIVRRDRNLTPDGVNRRC